MARSSVVDWHSTISQIFLNPKMPQALQDAIEDFPRARLMGHIWLCSSGTTTQGQVKLIGISKRAMLAAAKSANDHLQSTGRDTWLKVLPNFHVGGLAIFARAELSGARVIDQSQESWSPKNFYKMVESQDVTLSALVPSQVFDLVSLGRICPPKLRAIVVGAAALDPKLYAQARQLGYPVLPSFGMTECSSQIATADLKSLEMGRRTQRSFGSVRSSSGVVAQLKGELTDFPFPPLKILPHVEARLSQNGRLEVRSPGLCSIIYRLKVQEGANFSDKSKATLIEELRLSDDGWYLTEDRVELSGDTLVPRGRATEEVKILGEVVNFADLKSLLNQVISEVAGHGTGTVVACPDVRKGHRAVIVLDQALWTNAFEIVTRWNSRVLPVAKTVEAYFVGQLPRTALGKIADGNLIARLGI